MSTPQSVRRPAGTIANQAVVRGLDAASVIAAWAQSTAYSIGDERETAGQRAYRCTSITGAGTSAASGTGPAGQGDAITDSLVTWEYIGAYTLPATGVDEGFPLAGRANFATTFKVTGGTSIDCRVYLRGTASQEWTLDTDLGSAGTKTVNGGDTFRYSNTTDGADAVIVVCLNYVSTAVADAWCEAW